MLVASQEGDEFRRSTFANRVNIAQLVGRKMSKQAAQKRLQLTARAGLVW